MNLLPQTPIDWRLLYKLKVKRCPICGKTQLRRDDGEPRYIWLSTPPDRFDGGASPRAPIHFCRPERIRVTGEALLTEGALKSAVISFFLNCGVRGGGGVTIPDRVGLRR